MEIKIYKIRKGELFSSGGQNPHFTKRGKTWSAINHVRAHLTNYRKAYYYGATVRDIPDDWYIVEFNSLTGIKEWKANENN